MDENDKLWDLRFIRSRVEESFLAIQKAWMKRDINSVTDRITKNLYESLSAKIDLLIHERRINRLENIQINEINLYNITFFIDNECSSFIATFRYSMIDYYIDETTGVMLPRSKSETRDYIEYWPFVKSVNGWIVDEIIERYGIGGSRMREYTS